MEHSKYQTNATVYFFSAILQTDTNQINILAAHQQKKKNKKEEDSPIVHYIKTQVLNILFAHSYVFCFHCPLFHDGLVERGPEADISGEHNLTGIQCSNLSFHHKQRFYESKNSGNDSGIMKNLHFFQSLSHFI